MEAFLDKDGLRAVIQCFGLELALECRVEVLEAIAQGADGNVYRAGYAQSLLNARNALALVRSRNVILG